MPRAKSGLFFKKIEEMHKNSVDFIVNAASDLKSSLMGIEIASQFPFFYTSVGVHPHETENMSETDVETLKKLAEKDKVVAVGEIGLDFHYDFSPRDLQRKWFKRQLQLAKEVDLPVIIHSREAAKECFDIVKESGVNKGVIHSYSGSWRMALDYIDLGFYIGIGGMVTFKNAKKPIETVEKVPLERILLETDSPYLSPEPVRGTRNNSQNLSYICDKIAHIKQISSEIVAKITSENSMDLFSLK